MQTGTRSIWVLGILLAFAAAAGAQTVNGAITGVVKDSSGARRQGHGADAAQRRYRSAVGTTVSGAEGEYAFRNLAPAKYEVEAVKTASSR